MSVTDLLTRLRRDPLGLLRRAFLKKVLGPWRYRRGEGYDAEAYWRDRFTTYGSSLRGPGHEGLSERDNEIMYAAAGRLFLEYCSRIGFELKNRRVLEIGCGTGFYTDICRAAGVASYTGLDITDAQFRSLRERFPSFQFIKGDVSTTEGLGQYDVILMIDVLEHIVEERVIDAALAKIRVWLAPGAVFIASVPSPYGDVQSLFYLRFWPESYIVERFPGHKHHAGVPFRNGILFALRSPDQT
jgi:SAM-dependent methyltransferase